MPCVSCRDAHEVKDLHSGEMRPCVVCRKDEYEAWCSKLRPLTRRTATLDEYGRCCGRKPTPYKRDRILVCIGRCHAAFDIETRQQVPNWAWMRDGDSFVASYPTAELERLGHYRVKE